MVHERSALEPQVSLFDHARHLDQLYPDRPFPRGSTPFSDHCRHSGQRDDRTSAAEAVLREFLDDPALTPADLHELCAELPVLGNEVEEFAVTPRLLAAARWMIRNGTSRHSVGLALGLLSRHAEPRDLPVVRMLGRLGFAARLAADMCRRRGAVHDLIWLAERTSWLSLSRVVDELLAHPDPAVRQWVWSIEPDRLARPVSRRIAEEHGLADLLVDPDDALWDHAGALLLRTCGSTHHHFQILWYRDAPIAFQRWVEHARARPATLERAVLLAKIGQSLVSGSAALVAGSLRSELVAEINSVQTSWLGVLEARDRAEALRLTWLADQTTRNVVPDERFAIHVAAPPPGDFGAAEIRPMIDGLPIIAAAFERSACCGTKELLPGGVLLAEGAPREVRLADSYCGEPCSGALYVTIGREGSDVVWKDWRSTERHDRGPGEFRFDAAVYDEVIARAAGDHGWEWPGQTLARLLAAELRADPSVLGRWGCRFRFTAAWPRTPYETRLLFWSPDSSDDLGRWAVDVIVGDRDPADLAAEMLASMREADPRLTAKDLDR